MTPRLAVLRPEPGNAVTAARAEAAGFAVLRLPLFEIVPLDWIAPGARAHDALVLTSANAVRTAGPALGDLAALPVIAVGEQTATAARTAGLNVVATGDSDARSLGALLSTHGFARALHLGGRDQAAPPEGISDSIAVYASEPLAISATDLATLADTIALLHSPRAAVRLGDLLDATGHGRTGTAIAAFSPAIATAAGAGWKATAVAAGPTDMALFAAIAALRD